jgi:hypothetical protein
MSIWLNKYITVSKYIVNCTIFKWFVVSVLTTILKYLMIHMNSQEKMFKVDQEPTQ